MARLDPHRVSRSILGARARGRERAEAALMPAFAASIDPPREGAKAHAPARRGDEAAPRVTVDPPRDGATARRPR